MLGEKDYSIGRHPLWQIFRSFYQMTRPPIVLAGTLLLTGYFWAMVSRVECPLPEALVRFERREQMQRLKEVLSRWLPFHKARSASKPALVGHTNKVNEEVEL